jgi:hypothetical protein
MTKQREDIQCSNDKSITQPSKNKHERHAPLIAKYKELLGVMIIVTKRVYYYFFEPEESLLCEHCH